jgi:hypothetical protein
VKVVLAKRGAAVSAPPLLQGALALDLVVAFGLALAGPLRTWTSVALPLSVTAAWIVSGYGVLLALCDVAAARMSATAITWRRRLGYVAMGAVVWRRGLDLPREVAVATVAWMGFVWIALVVAGRALSRSIAAATGEDKPE